jgi:predicted flap endonuclease-1-like 5' DNA nuclease
MRWRRFLVGALIGLLLSYLLYRYRRIGMGALSKVKTTGVGADMEARRARAARQALDIGRLHASETAVGLTPPAVPLEPDNLALLEGIGPKINQILGENGISTFAQLAASSAEHLRSILDLGGSRFRMADPTTWPMQARLARDGKWDELKAYQATLKGGRIV